MILLVERIDGNSPFLFSVQHDLTACMALVYTQGKIQNDRLPRFFALFVTCLTLFFSLQHLGAGRFGFASTLSRTGQLSYLSLAT